MLCHLVERAVELRPDPRFRSSQLHGERNKRPEKRRSKWGEGGVCVLGLVGAAPSTPLVYLAPSQEKNRGEQRGQLALSDITTLT